MLIMLTKLRQLIVVGLIAATKNIKNIKPEFGLALEIGDRLLILQVTSCPPISP
jgi:hypothetical protein